MKKKNPLLILSDISFPILMVAIFVLVILLTNNGKNFSQYNFIMLNISFLLIVLSYFLGLTGSLIMSTATVFAVSSVHLYNNIFNGVPAGSSLYYWGAFILISSMVAGLNRHSVSKMQNENVSAKEAIESFSTIDKDTGLFNDKALSNDLTIFMNLAQRNHFTVSLMLIRPKHLTELQRIVGPDRFPRLLKALALCIKSVMRFEDRMYLIDDYTFAAILVANEDGVKVVVDKVKDAVESNKFEDVAYPLRIDVEISITSEMFNPRLKMSTMDFIADTKKNLK